MTEAYCKASQAVDNDKYLKENFCKLLKYKTALTNERCEPGPILSISLERQSRLLDKLNKEVERRKTKFRAFGLSAAKYILAPVLVGVILYFIYPILPSDRSAQNIAPPQSHQQKVPTPQATPRENKPGQPKQETSASKFSDINDNITVHSGDLCDIAEDKYRIECMETMQADQPPKSIAGQMVWDPNRQLWRKQLKFFNGAHKTDVTIKMIEYLRNVSTPIKPGDPWKPKIFTTMAGHGVVYPEFR